MSKRDCQVINISDGGVRLHVEGFDVPDEFVLLLSGDGVAWENAHKVVWRRGYEIGASAPALPCTIPSEAGRTVRIDDF